MAQGGKYMAQENEWKYFKGTLEITVEVKSENEAVNLFYRIVNDLMNDPKRFIYAIKRTKLEEC